MTIISQKAAGDRIGTAEMNALLNKVQNGSDFDLSVASMPYSYVIFRRENTYYGSSSASGLSNVSSSQASTVFRTCLSSIKNIGGTLFVKSGRYSLGDAVLTFPNVSHEISIIGESCEGEGTTEGNSAGSILAIGASTCVSIEGSSNNPKIRIENIKFQTSNAAPLYGIDANNVSELILKNIFIIDLNATKNGTAIRLPPIGRERCVLEFVTVDGWYRGYKFNGDWQYGNALSARNCKIAYEFSDGGAVGTILIQPHAYAPSAYGFKKGSGAPKVQLISPEVEGGMTDSTQICFENWQGLSVLHPQFTNQPGTQTLFSTIFGGAGPILGFDGRSLFSTSHTEGTPGNVTTQATGYNTKFTWFQIPSATSLSTGVTTYTIGHRWLNNNRSIVKISKIHYNVGTDSARIFIQARNDSGTNKQYQIQAINSASSNYTTYGAIVFLVEIDNALNGNASLTPWG